MKISLKFLFLSVLALLAQNSFSALTTKITDYHTDTDKSSSTNGSVIVGVDNTVSEYQSIAFGRKNKANGKYSVAFGLLNEAEEISSIAIGMKNIASEKYSSALGSYNRANKKFSTAMGHENAAEGEESTAIGHRTYVSGKGSGAFGIGDYDFKSEKASYKIEGNNSWAIGSHNKIAAGSDNNHILGNNVSIGSDKLNINDSVVLGNESTVEESQVVSVGSATKKRKIVHLAEGVNDTDAVNVAQLKNLKTEVDNRFADVKSEINHVGSLSAALSALHPMQYDPQAPNQIMAGFGHYRNKQSVAVGMSHYFSDNVLMTAGVAIGSERRVKTMANVGLTWKIGKGGSSSSTNAPQYIVQDEMNRLTKENNQLKAQVNSQNDKLQRQDDRINAQAQEIEIMKQQLNILLKKK